MKEMTITNDWIDRYNDNELNELEKSYFQQQMASNPLLRKEVYIDAQLNSFLRDEDLLELMQKVQAVAGKHNRAGRQMRYLAIAASVVCLIVLGGILYRVEKKTLSLPATEHEPTRLSLKKPQQNNVSGEGLKEKGPTMQLNPAPPVGILRSPQLAENYKPMAEFELMIGSVTRSTQVRLVEPIANISIKAGAPLLFRWIAQNNQSGVTIFLLSNHGEVVFETPVIREREYTFQTKGLPYGLYYWKIMCHEELVMMGKFTLD